MLDTNGLKNEALYEYMTKRVIEITTERNIGVRELDRLSGVDKSKISRVYNNKAIFNPEELEELAMAFDMTKDRLFQKDTIEMNAEIAKLIKSRTNVAKLVTLAEKVHSLSAGFSESASTSKQLAVAYFLNSDKEKANTYFDHALAFAKRSNNHEIVEDVCNGYMTALYRSKEIVKLASVCEEYKMYFKSNAGLGNLNQYIALVAYENKDYDKAKEFLYVSADFYNKADDKVNQARVKNNIATILYEQDGDYENALSVFAETKTVMFENSILSTCAWIENQIVNILMLQNKTEQAIETINNALETFTQETIDIQAIRAKLLYKKAELTSSAEIAEMVLEMKVGNQIKLNSANFLVQHAFKTGDLMNAQKFHAVLMSAMSNGDVVIPAHRL